MRCCIAAPLILGKSRKVVEKMFGFGKKDLVAGAPAVGRILDITEVKDEVFSAKMMGDGIAVEPEGNEIIAPCDAKVTLVAGTRHAIGLEASGVELLIHVGLDTVELEGKGFEVNVKEGAMVIKGDKLMSFDREYIVSQGKPLTTMLVLTNMDSKVKGVTKKLDQPDGVLVIKVK